MNNLNNELKEIEKLDMIIGRFKNEMLREISKILGEDEYFLEKAIYTEKNQEGKTYTFYKDNDSNNFIERYNWCQRPCDTNMSLKKFDKNGEVHCWMSESLAEENRLEKIDLDEFIHKFVKPIIKENINLKRKLNIKNNKL